ncbi:MAG TPA: glycosyltransferase family 9 protein, partial [Candidatus Krumholzibacteria bacterium]|nr:glycosyltransferase family 9 protein [Candidatus Krumholzibacteria bacterium]
MSELAAPLATRLQRDDRVLVTRLNYLGDVVLSLPLVEALHARWPGIEIDYLARRPGADLLAGDPRFARVFAVGDGLASTLTLISDLRARRYRAVIDLYSNPRSAWLAWLSGAPVRIGGNRRGRRRLYTHPIAVPPEVRRVTDVFMRYGVPLGIASDARAGTPSLSITPAEQAAADALLSRASRRPLVGVHPGGKWSVKRWPSEKFVELVNRLRNELGAEVVVFTGPDEHHATEPVRTTGARILDVMPIRTLAAVISRLDAMVACDGGVMHVSAAVGTPTVGIFGSSEPAVWFPYHAPHRAAFIEVE